MFLFTGEIHSSIQVQYSQFWSFVQENCNSLDILCEIWNIFKLDHFSSRFSERKISFFKYKRLSYYFNCISSYDFFGFENGPSEYKRTPFECVALFFFLHWRLNFQAFCIIFLVAYSVFSSLIFKKNYNNKMAIFKALFTFLNTLQLFFNSVIWSNSTVVHSMR